MKFFIILLISLIYSKEITSIYNIEGMMCAENCPKMIKKSIIDIKGIKSCNVDFNNEIATIIYNDELIDSDKIEKIISKKTYFKINEISGKNSIWNWLFGDFFHL